ncbi:hypothetical protein ES703_72724 [subsurface metagenome]
MLEPVAPGVPLIGIEFHSNARLDNLVHNCPESRQLAGVAVCFEANLLAVVGSESAHYVQRITDLLNRLLSRDAIVKAVREYSYTAAAYIPAEFYVGLGIFNCRFKLRGLRRIIPLTGRKTH